MSQDQSDAAVGTTGGNGSPTYTYLPQVGQVIGRGQELFAIDGQPSILLYGDVTPWRAFMPGMAPGPDVAALNTNLDALGYGKGMRGRRVHGGDRSGGAEVPSGSPYGAHWPAGPGFGACSSPAQIEVNSVTPTIGSTPSAGGAVLQVTLTARQVQIALDASQQSDVAVGDNVSIVMPNNSTTPGVVSYVGTVATTPSSQNGGSGSPTIEVNVTPLDPAATGNLDDLPVNVWITQASVPNALVVQVDALIALAGGGYALEVAPAHGAHYLEAVTRWPVRRRRRDGPGERLWSARRPASGGTAGMTPAVDGASPERRAEHSRGRWRRPARPAARGRHEDLPVEPPVEALRGVSFTIRQGELLAIVGPSGSGKTTLLHLMGALDRPTTGRVLVTGFDVAKLADRELSALRATRIGFVFQQFFLAEHQSVLDNVADGLLYAGASLD